MRIAVLMLLLTLASGNLPASAETVDWSSIMHVSVKSLVLFSSAPRFVQLGDTRP
jgi:hypothetical protein